LLGTTQNNDSATVLHWATVKLLRLWSIFTASNVPASHNQGPELSILLK